MPFYDRPRDLAVLGVAVRAFAYEPLVWVSLTPHEVTVLPPDAPRFPAVVDTGNTLALNIRESHLTAWTRPGLRAADLPLAAPPAPVHDASGRVVPLPRRRARVWLHPYPEGSGLAPLDLQPAGGVLVYESPPTPGGQPAGSPPVGPHLPLLGARGLISKGLVVCVDYKRLLVTIRSDDLPPPAAGGWLRKAWRKVWPGGAT
jgi:hypothetical protein